MHTFILARAMLYPIITVVLQIVASILPCLGRQPTDELIYCHLTTGSDMRHLVVIQDVRGAGSAAELADLHGIYTSLQKLMIKINNINFNT